MPADMPRLTLFDSKRAASLYRDAGWNYTSVMWRRVATVCLLWIGLSGLLPAALACTMDASMATMECCQDHEQQPCDKRVSVTPDQFECCASDASSASTAIASIDKPKQALVHDVTDAPLASNSWAGALRRLPSRLGVSLAPRRYPSDQSHLWLQTARLRL